MKSEVRSRTQGVGSRKHCRGRGGRYPLGAAIPQQEALGTVLLPTSYFLLPTRYPLGAAIPQQEALGTVRMGVPLHRLHHLLMLRSRRRSRQVPLYRCVVSVSVKELCRGLFVVVPL